MKLSKLLLATIGAAVLLGALVGSASAGRFSTSSQTWRAAFRTVTFRGGFGDMKCSVTLEGSLHTRTIAKTAGLLIASMTRSGCLASSTIVTALRGTCTMIWGRG